MSSNNGFKIVEFHFISLYSLAVQFYQVICYLSSSNIRYEYENAVSEIENKNMSMFIIRYLN